MSARRGGGFIHREGWTNFSPKEIRGHAKYPHAAFPGGSKGFARCEAKTVVPPPVVREPFKSVPGFTRTVHGKASQYKQWGVSLDASARPTFSRGLMGMSGTSMLR